MIEPPYYAVIFTSRRTPVEDGYEDASAKMMELAARQPGFLGVESARDATGLGMTVSYWTTLEAIANWRNDAQHRVAQVTGRKKWYSHYETRIARVERSYRFSAGEE